MYRAVLGLLFPAASSSDISEQVWGCNGPGSFRISFFQLYFASLTFVSDLPKVFQWSTVWGIFIETCDLVF